MSDPFGTLTFEAASTVDRVAEELRADGVAALGLAADVTDRAAVEALRELRKSVKPDPDGLTIRDYIEMGRRH